MGGYISEKSNTSLLGSNRLGRGFIVHTIVFLDTVGSMVDFDDIKTNNQQYKNKKTPITNNITPTSNDILMILMIYKNTYNQQYSPKGVPTVFILL